MKIEGYFNGHIFETLTPVNPLRAKVSVVRRKDIPNMLFFSQTNTRGIGQVHGMIAIFLHQDFVVACP